MAQGSLQGAWGGRKGEGERASLFPSTRLSTVTLGMPLTLSQAFYKKGFGPHVPPGRDRQGLVMEHLECSSKGIEEEDSKGQDSPPWLEAWCAEILH